MKIVTIAIDLISWSSWHSMQTATDDRKKIAPQKQLFGFLLRRIVLTRSSRLPLEGKPSSDLNITRRLSNGSNGPGKVAARRRHVR